MIIIKKKNHEKHKSNKATLITLFIFGNLNSGKWHKIVYIFEIKSS